MTMEINSWLAKADAWYVKKPAVRALMQLAGTLTLGTVSAIDAGIVQKIQNIKENRAKIFFEELDRGNIHLTEEMIKSDDFLHAFYATTKVAMQSRREEKIKLFASYLKSICQEKTPTQSIDEYEEYLCILDELSYREFQILGILEKYEQEHPVREKQTEVQRTDQYWKQFKSEISGLLNISQDEVISTLTRLNRTGLYREITGTYFDYHGGQGVLTEMYYKLKKMIAEA